MKLSAGKYRGMCRISDRNGIIRITAINQRPAVENLVAERSPDGKARYEDVGQLKELLLEELSGVSSAMLIDPAFALSYAYRSIDPACGLILTVDYGDIRKTPAGWLNVPNAEWTVAKIKRLGADAVHMPIWYHPDAEPEILLHQKNLVQSVGDACRRYDIPFLLGPVSYPLQSGSNGGSDAKRVLLRTVEEFNNDRYGVDVLELENPLSAEKLADPALSGIAQEAAQNFYNQLGSLIDRPWVMLTAGSGMEAYRRVLTYAFRAGASGYLSGRAIWREAAERFPALDEVRAMLRGVSVENAKSIQHLAGLQALPWTRRSPAADAAEMLDAGPSFVTLYPDFDSA